MFSDRRQLNRRKYSGADRVSQGEQRFGERRSRNGLFSVSDQAWWLKVNYLDDDPQNSNKQKNAS